MLRGVGIAGGSGTSARVRRATQSLACARRDASRPMSSPSSAPTRIRPTTSNVSRFISPCRSNWAPVRANSSQRSYSASTAAVIVGTSSTRLRRVKSGMQELAALAGLVAVHRQECVGERDAQRVVADALRVVVAVVDAHVRDRLGPDGEEHAAVGGAEADHVVAAAGGLGEEAERVVAQPSEVAEERAARRAASPCSSVRGCGRHARLRPYHGTRLGARSTRSSGQGGGDAVAASAYASRAARSTVWWSTLSGVSVGRW